jgi:hypothetical protein
MPLRYHQSGNSRAWEHRPSDHRRTDANRRYVAGPILPMEQPGWFARLFGRRS